MEEHSIWRNLMSKLEQDIPAPLHYFTVYSVDLYHVYDEFCKLKTKYGSSMTPYSAAAKAGSELVPSVIKRTQLYETQRRNRELPVTEAVAYFRFNCFFILSSDTSFTWT